MAVSFGEEGAAPRLGRPMLLFEGKTQRPIQHEVHPITENWYEEVRDREQD